MRSTHYPIPASLQEISALVQNQQVNAEMVASVIVGVVQMGREQGQSLEDLTLEILKDDSVLSSSQRRWLSQLVQQVWETLS
jgi:hypothetical protein